MINGYHLHGEDPRSGGNKKKLTGCQTTSLLSRDDTLGPILVGFADEQNKTRLLAIPVLMVHVSKGGHHVVIRGSFTSRLTALHIGNIMEPKRNT